jgi:hypothetical protein
MCGVSGITSVEDALRLPKGKLLRAVTFSRYGPRPLGWIERRFSDRHVRWAAKQVIKHEVTRNFSTQAQLIAFAVKEYPWSAFFRGFDGSYRSEAPKRRGCGGGCSGCPLKR